MMLGAKEVNGARITSMTGTREAKTYPVIAAICPFSSPPSPYRDLDLWRM